MATFLLVHSPLVGPTTWAGVADSLRTRGHAALVPSIRPAVDAERPYWRQACAASVAVVDGLAPGEPLVLVGHSGAGPRLPVITAELVALGHPPTVVVFVDAGLPVAVGVPGDHLSDELRTQLRSIVQSDGKLPPWPEWWPPQAMAHLVPDDDLRGRIVAECRPVPADLFDEPVPVPPDWDRGRELAYLSFSYDHEATVAEQLGWIVGRAPGTHLEQVTDPDGVTDQLLLTIAATGVRL